MTSVLPLRDFHGVCTLGVRRDGRTQVITWLRLTFPAAPRPCGCERVKAAWKYMADVADPAPAGFRRESILVWWHLSGLEVRFRVVDLEAGG